LAEHNDNIEAMRKELRTEERSCALLKSFKTDNAIEKLCLTPAQKATLKTDELSDDYALVELAGVFPVPFHFGPKVTVERLDGYAEACKLSDGRSLLDVAGVMENYVREVYPGKIPDHSVYNRLESILMDATKRIEGDPKDLSTLVALEPFSCWNVMKDYGDVCFSLIKGHADSLTELARETAERELREVWCAEL
jgi:hypothetical protein